MFISLTEEKKNLCGGYRKFFLCFTSLLARPTSVWETRQDREKKTALTNQKRCPQVSDRVFFWEETSKFPSYSVRYVFWLKMPGRPVMKSSRAIKIKCARSIYHDMYIIYLRRDGDRFCCDIPDQLAILEHLDCIANDISHNLDGFHTHTYETEDL